jgi:predicted O-linked N-acetylglucosamine transferase (SPINDLY family)
MSAEQLPDLVARAVALHQAGRLGEAEALYRQVLEVEPRHAAALTMLGTLHAQRRNPAEAERLFGMSLEADPFQAGALYNRGIVLAELKRFEEALASYERALALKPDDPVILNSRAIVLAELKRFEEALESYNRAIAIKAEYPDAFFNRGMVLSGLNRREEALESYDRALAIRPNDARVHFHRANVLIELRRYREAVDGYDHAIALEPAHTLAFNNRGNALAELRRHQEALESFDRAIALKPDYPEALFNRGVALSDLKRHEEAIASYRNALAIRPDCEYGAAMLASSRMHICEWRERSNEVARLTADVRARKTGAVPFPFLALSDSAHDQLLCSRIWVRDKCPASAAPIWKGEHYRHDRIRVAYLSADFHEHAMAFCLAGMFEAHDRRRFDTTAVSFGPKTPNRMRSRLERAFDRFIDARQSGDQEVACLLRELEIDIAVDLNGFTSGGRTRIFALRAVPIQVSYLGYPGTMGADYIDYVLADRLVIPEHQLPCYTEKVVYLPDTYQVNDSKRVISDRTPTRAEAGLPEQGFVFCSFNNSYKISPEVFDAWMAILGRVEGSVLWLVDSSSAAVRNLSEEAAARGIARGRLVFAPKIRHEDYLARYRLADLALDTLPYNGHGTTSDALWAGLPVLTCAGNAMPGRVAASLLSAVGLPELVTRSLEEYEALAIALAREPERLRRIRDKLARNRLTCPLFDTARFTRHLEAAYEEMVRLHHQGESPRHFSVAPLAGQAAHAADDR